MKKWIICLSVLMCSSVVMFAKKPLSLTEGKVKNLREVFYQKDQQMLVEMDYSATMWEDDGQYKEFCGNDYEKRVNDSYVAFIEAFNHKNKNMIQATADPNANTRGKVVVKIDKLERKNGSSAWGRMYIRMYGTVTVYDMTKKAVASAEIYKLAGEEDYVEDDRLKKCFAALAEELKLLGK